jgi:hypothetical protein
MKRVINCSVIHVSYPWELFLFYRRIHAIWIGRSDKESCFAITVKRCDTLYVIFVPDYTVSSVPRIRTHSETTIRITTNWSPFRNTKLVNWKQSTALGYLFLTDDTDSLNCVCFTKSLLQGVSTFHYKTSRIIPLVLWDSPRTQSEQLTKTNSIRFCYGELPNFHNPSLLSILERQGRKRLLVRYDSKLWNETGTRQA